MGRRETDEDKVPAEPVDTWAKQSSWMGSWDWEPEVKARRREERGELLAEERRCWTQSQWRKWEGLGGCLEVLG